MTGKNVPENRNSGSWRRVIFSKSCHDDIQVVAAIATALKAKPISSVAGRARTAHQVCTRPRAHITTRNAAEYDAPRSWPQRISPRAMSLVVSGVASIWS